jgi:hypothetical protein
MPSFRPPQRRLVRYIHEMRAQANAGELPFLRQALEMLVLAALTGNGPGYYLMGGFYRRSMPWADKRGHLGQSEYQRRIMKINPVEYQKISQHKLTEKAVLSLLHFPTPRFLGYLHREAGATAAAKPLSSLADFTAFLETEPTAEMCFKLVEGWSGRGFAAIRKERDGHGPRVRLLNTGELISPEALFTLLTKGEGRHGRIVEQLMHQHEALARFNASSVNTCRIWVVKPSPAAPAQCVLSFLRVGRAQSLVDNISAGGLSVPVDLATGVTGTAVAGGPLRRYFTSHPDHGGRLDGQRLPYWDEAKRLAIDVLAAFPGLRFAGADIAFAPSGPVVIELNPLPERNGACVFNIPTGRVIPAR